MTLIGHSLGAALALLDAVYLPLHLPASTAFKTVGYGLPRVGNQAFADFVDQQLNLTHVSHGHDPVPIVPGRDLGFVHPSGEVHISNDNDDLWLECPGQDTETAGCTIDSVPNIVESNVLDHLFFYDGLKLGGCDESLFSGF